MTRLLRLFALLATLTAVAAIAFAGVALSSPDDDPDEVKRLRDGVAELADWMGSMQGEGQLATKLPGLDTSIGSTLALKDGMTTLKSAVAATEADDVADLAAKLQALPDGFPVTPGDSREIALTTSNVVTTGPVYGFDLSVVATRAVTKTPMALSAAAASGKPELALKASQGEGVPLQARFEATYHLRYDADRGFFYVEASDAGTPGDASDDTPKLTARGAVAGFELPSSGFSSAIGFGDLAVDGGSTFDLDANVLGDVTDPNADGKLAFQEPGNPNGGDQLIDAELRLPPSQTVSFARTGSVAADIKFDSPYTSSDDDVTLSLTANQLTNSQPGAVAGGADLDELVQFTNVRAVDVLSGLAQYANVLRALQTNRNVDAELPLLSGRLSDAVEVSKDVADFVDAHTQQVAPGQPIDDATDFRTAGELVAKLQAASGGLRGLQDSNGGADGKLTPTYDPAADLLRFDLKLAVDKLNDPEEPIPAPPAGPNGQQAIAIGLPQVGGELAQLTGIGSLGSAEDNPQSQAKRKTAFTVSVPFVIDLANATPANDDPATDGIAEFEAPMPNERYRIDTSGQDEITATAEVRTPVSGDGQVGFVGFTAANGSKLEIKRADTSKPMVAAQVDATRAGLPAVASISRVMRTLSDNDNDTANDPVVPSKPNWRVDGELLEDAHGPGSGGNPDDYRLTDSLGKVELHWADANQALAPGDVTLDDSAKLLKGLNFVPSEPGALLGRTLDQAEGLVKQINGVFDSVPGLDKDIPFVGTSARDLFAAGRTLDAQLKKLREQPPATLQDLETELQDKVAEALKINDEDLKRGLVRFSLKNLGDANSAPELIARIGVNQTTSEDRPVSLAVGNLGASIAGAEAGGKIHVQALADFDLAFPVTLDANPPSGLKILDSSGLTLSASAKDETGALSLQAGVGPLKLRLGDGGRLAAGVRFRAGTGPDGAQVPEANEQPLSITDFLNQFDANIGPSQDGGFDCNVNAGVPVHGELACIALPVFLNNQPINGADPAALSNFLRVTVDGNLTPSIQLPDGLNAQTLSNSLLNFGSLQDGIAKLRAILDLAVQGVSYGAKLPLIGDKLSAGSKVLDGINKLADDLETFAAATDKPVGEIDSGLREVIFKALPTALLPDSDYGPAGVFPGDKDNVSSPTDIRVLLLCGDDKHLCVNGETMSQLSDVSIDLELGMGNPKQCRLSGDAAACPDGTDLPIDFGVPGLNLRGADDGSKPVNASAGWRLNLGFGVNKAGFYVKDNPLPASGQADAGDTDPELQLGFRVGLNQAANNQPELNAQIGFLDIAMDDKQPGGSSLQAGFSADLKAPGGSVDACDKVVTTSCGKLIDIAAIPGLDVRDVLLPKVSGGLNVLLGISTGVDIPGTGQIGKKLPKVTGDFKFGWNFDQDSIRNLPEPKIAFENIAIDPGTLFGETLNPIFRGMQRFTKPVEPVREFMFAPIPVVSDLSRTFGGGDISFVDLAETFGETDLSMMRDINGLLDFIDNLPAANNNVAIPIGDFKVPGSKAVGSPPTPDQAKSYVTGASPGSGDSKLGAAEDKLGAGDKDKLEKMIDGTAGGGSDSSKDIEIPILEKPDCIFGMLMGGDCDLFRYRPDPFEVRFDYEQSFGPFFGVLYVTVGGYAGAAGRLDIGYDTRGIRELIQDIKAGDANAESAADLLDGVFLGDLAQDGSDPNELEVRAGITAGAKLSAVIVEAGARGGIDATVGLNLHDGPELDGKLRIDEIRRKLNVPFCLFDVAGRLSAYLEAYIKAGLGPFSVSKSFELTRVTLLDFSEGLCPNTEPVLATKQGDTLRLNVGADDGARGAGWSNSDLDNHGDESYVVRQTGPDSVSVTALGFTKAYSGIGNIVINDAGDGNDSFLFQGLKEGGAPGETVGASPGAKGDFTLKVVAKSLGAGNDNITTGTAGDDVDGGAGNDTINGGLGGDVLKGSAGDDTIGGGPGDDEIHGGADPDNLDGGLGSDHVYGEGGGDRIDGGRDLVGPGSLNNTSEGTDKGDFLYGGPDGDEIDGGSGEDEIHGDEELHDDADGAASGGNDVIAGGLDTDTVYAGNGDDTVFGGLSEDVAGLPVDTHKDRLHGNGGKDTVRGGLGDDELFGGNGDDAGFGDEGDDDIQGQGGDDTLRGSVGTDTIHGGDGGDTIHGEQDADHLFGGNDSDLVTGAAGNDDIDGGSGDDRLADGGGLYGDAGDDDIKGGADRDDLFGGAGEDVALGDDGTIGSDRAVSPQPSVGAADRLFGDNDADRMYGEGGDDALEGGPAGDLEFGNDGADRILGQTGTDRLIGGSAQASAGDSGDAMFGGTENDVLLGDNGTIAANFAFALGATGVAGTAGDDLLNGGPGEDVLHGQDGDDTEFGAEGLDRMFGDLGGDTIFGQDGPDYMLGDQGAVNGATVALENANDGGQDVMDGGPATDHMYGGADDDTMAGGFADDTMEGNGGRDRMYGASKTASDGIAQASDVADAMFDGQDDMIGGSSPVNPETIDRDEGELEMRGDGAQDVMTGDNATITRPGGIDNITGGAARDVVLLDTEKRGSALADVGGPDTMLGNDGNDRMYGESDTDTVKGNGDEDYLEGNQDRDWVEGNAAQDDIVGGSAMAGQPDDGDYLHGGDGPDVIAGDNAVITRDPAKPGGPYTYVTDRLEMPTKRYVKLLDLTNPAADTAGADQIAGGAATDVLFGQDAGDFQSGGSGDDYMEGNGDTDRQWGDAPLAQAVGVPPVIGALTGAGSTEPELSGAPGADGQDDQIGGSSIKGHRDAGDIQHGDGAADFQLGDNGELLRRRNATGTAYLTYDDANVTTLQRQANRFDVGGAATAAGADQQFGEAGDDYQYGQDGNDYQYGGADNDDQYGELGDDRMFGEAGEDAMIGDRGVIADDLIQTGDADDPAQFTVTTPGPTFNSYTAFRPNTLHRFVDLNADGDGDMDGDGNPVEKPGLTTGGGDFMRGGDGKDWIHGAFGDDVANGDNGGDIVYGDDGADALWGGRGSADAATQNERGADDSLVDYVFGGRGGDPSKDQGLVTGGADVIDYRPRAIVDPAAWADATDLGGPVDKRQHHQGVDWIYGGFDRDVMQSDVADNGPDKGDRLMDWTGAYNLFTHCQASYGDDNDLRQISPDIVSFLEKLAFGTGAGTSLAEVQNASSSAYREVAIVYQPDVKNNSGKAYPTTPGHFDDVACAD